MITFTIPGEPQGKGRPRVGRVAGQARMFTPAKTVAYEGLIAHAAAQAMQGRPPMAGAVVLRLTLTHAVPRSWSKKRRAAALAGQERPTVKPDADNVLKAIGDGANGVLWQDDRQIVDVQARRWYGEIPGVRVEAWEWEGDE